MSNAGGKITRVAFGPDTLGITPNFLSINPDATYQREMRFARTALLGFLAVLVGLLDAGFLNSSPQIKHDRPSHPRAEQCSRP
jgi:hypothetical protein